MSKLSLSICIATHNRSNFLGETLQSIICQATQAVEIVVLDGASTDDTTEVVRGYQQQFPGLRYIRQNTNSGVDRDFAEAVSQAKGEYCWLFSDDDLLKPGAIQTVLNAIEANHGLIIANAEIRDADLSKVLQLNRLELGADRSYKPSESERLLADMGDYLSFIGCVIIKRQLWNSREREKYFGSNFIHVGVIFQSPLPENTLVIASPLISIRYGNASWLAKYFEVWMFRWPDLIWSFSGYSELAKLRVCRKEPWRAFRTLLHYRAKGSYTIVEYVHWLRPRLESAWSRFMSKAIAYIPGRIANLLAVAYYSCLFRKRDQSIVLVDLMNSPFYFRRWGKKRAPATNTSVAVKSVTGPSIVVDQKCES